MTVISICVVHVSPLNELPSNQNFILIHFDGLLDYLHIIVIHVDELALKLIDATAVIMMHVLHVSILQLLLRHQLLQLSGHVLHVPMLIHQLHQHVTFAPLLSR